MSARVTMLISREIAGRVSRRLRTPCSNTRLSGTTATPAPPLIRLWQMISSVIECGLAGASYGREAMPVLARKLAE